MRKNKIRILHVAQAAGGVDRYIRMLLKYLDLMSLCKHFVISNSTFSWWAQYLSSNLSKIVIAPSVWRNTELKPIDIFSENWILMDNDGNIVSNGEK